MAKHQKLEPKPVVENGVDLHSDGWDRFERAVDAAVKSGPKHKAGSAPKPARKPRKATSGTNA